MYLKTKLRSYEGKINTNFHNNKESKNGSQYICLIDSAFKTDESYYPQGFSDEYKYIIKFGFSPSKKSVLFASMKAP